MGLTVGQENLVQQLANLAYGTGFKEHELGGKGNMGLVRDQYGTMRVVKFNTHRSQEAAAQKAALGNTLSTDDDDKGASDALRTELVKIAEALDLDPTVVLADGNKPLLTRKIVANFVSKIAENAESGLDARTIWDNARETVQRQNLKSAKDMSFETVVKPKSPDYGKYSRRVECFKAKGLTVSKDIPLFDKTFDLYVENLKCFESRNQTIHDFMQNVGLSAQKREPEVHDYLIASCKKTTCHTVTVALLLSAGYPDPGMVKNKVSKLSKLAWSLKYLLENNAGKMRFDTFLQPFKEAINDARTANRQQKLTDDELKMSFMKFLIGQMPKGVRQACVREGIFGKEERFTYVREGNTYTSGTLPRGQLLAQHGVSEGPSQKNPLAGLSVSSLTVHDTDSGKARTLSTVNRFGSIDSNSPEDNVANYKALAVQTFLASPKLLEKAKTGDEIEVPIYRFDMAPENGKFLLPNEEENELRTEITFKGAKGEDTTVTLKPKVRHLQTPVDSFKDYFQFVNSKTGDLIKSPTDETVILHDDQVESLCAAINELVVEAQKTDLDEKTKAEVEQLTGQLSNYSEHLKSTYFTDNRWSGIKLSKTIGHEMFRVGARLALLASKLGHIPAINCNKGRDRTGAMDNEIKMLALQLEEKQTLAPIRQNDESGDEDRELRSDLLVKNGENDLARQITGGHPINTNQSQGFMNFGVLFDNTVLKAN